MEYLVRYNFFVIFAVSFRQGGLCLIKILFANEN